MTTQREAKKAAKKAAEGQELATLVIDAEIIEEGMAAEEIAEAEPATPWEVKLRAALMTGRPGIIYAQLVAWEAEDPPMHQEYGRRKEFRFAPGEVAHRRALQLELGLTNWPLYGLEGAR